jgi:hypothetical protein
MNRRRVAVAAAAIGLAIAAIPLARLDAVSSGQHVLRANEHYCDGCTPPLLYFGGPVVDTSGKGFTVTPVYWLPSGYSLPAGYVSSINRYVANVAAASGRTDNVYSVAGEYYQKTPGGGRSYLHYKIAAGAPVVDPAPFPASACKVRTRGDTACISDGQLTAELGRLIRGKGLPTGLGYFYPVFFPAKVETSDGAGGSSGMTYCAYHSVFGSGKGTVLYGNEPFVACDQGQAPNGNLFTDGSIDTLSHELMETMTDPADKVAWATKDKTFVEIGDICTPYYGAPLGSTNAGNPGGTEYNQVINGGKYYTQSYFSNASFKSLGVGNGCQLSEGAVRRGVVGSRLILNSYLSDITVPADGKSTSTDHIWVTDKQGYAVQGDAITFSTYVIAGSGVCGTVNRKSGKSDDGGAIDVVYTASSDNVECGVVASEAKGGKSVTAPVYQGSADKLAPTADDTIPETLTAGKTGVFTVTFDNRGNTPINFGTVDFEIFPDSDTSPKVTASQIRLSVSQNGAGGPFTTLKLSGTTAADDSIEGRYSGPKGLGVNIPPHHWWRFTFHVTLSTNFPSLGDTPVVDFESYLDQLNPASATYTTLADTGYTAIAINNAG